ncbi:MAG: hypothetical protein ACI9CD_000293 [Candidatus Deianiraeaceae bacterium]|jgi:hypothetical protein
MSINTAKFTDTKLTISLPRELHALIKLKAALKHTTVKEIVTIAIINSFENDFDSLNEKTKKELEWSIKDFEEYKEGKNKQYKSFANVEDVLKELKSSV